MSEEEIPVAAEGRSPDEGDGAAQATTPGLRARRPSVPPAQGRWAVIISVAVVVVGIAIIAALDPVSSSNPAPTPTDAVPVAPAGAVSSSAFCAAGAGTAAATTIYLTNSTAKVVTGTMTTIGPAASGAAVPTVHTPVAVPAHGTAAINPATGLPAGNNASSFVFAGGGVVVTQVVSGPNGWSTAPCASVTSGSWSFAGGSTTTGDTLTLTLFNPTATGAVVSISFLTTTGVVTPQAYQGLVVPAGSMVEENVGDFVQAQAAIATSVTALSGSLVSTEFQQWSSGANGGLSLRLGSPALSEVWRFAQTTNTAKATIDFYLANPATTPVDATATFGLSSGSVLPRHIVLPPLSLTVFTASGTAGLPQQVPFATTFSATAPIVVGRSVQAAAGASPPVWGASSGTVSVGRHWLVPAPGTATAPGTANAAVNSLAVADPGQGPAAVTITPLGATRPIAMVTLAPGHLVVLDGKNLGTLATLVVTSSEPVNVEEDNGPSGAAGIVSSTGFQLTG